MNVAKIIQELQQFHGTENYYEHLFQKRYTDGVKYLCEKFGCYWLLDVFVSYQYEEKFQKEAFQVLDLKVNEDKSCKCTITDGNDNILMVQEIEFTDFPLSEYRLFYSNDVIMLPSEY